jgi:hypothetical protein
MPSVKIILVAGKGWYALTQRLSHRYFFNHPCCYCAGRCYMQVLGISQELLRWIELNPNE